MIETFILALMIFNTLSFIFFSKESFLISEMLEFKVKVFYLHVCEIISSFHISLFSKLWRLSKLHFKGIKFSHNWIVDGNLLHSALNRAWHFWLSTRFYRKYPKMFKTGFIMLLCKSVFCCFLGWFFDTEMRPKY